MLDKCLELEHVKDICQAPIFKNESKEFCPACAPGKNKQTMKHDSIIRNNTLKLCCDVQFFLLDLDE
jgi:hypothetical protein